MDSVLDYIVRFEELIRGDAISMACTTDAASKLPWGACLLKAANRRRKSSYFQCLLKEEGNLPIKVSNPPSRDNTGSGKGRPKGDKSWTTGNTKDNNKGTTKGNTKGNPLDDVPIPRKRRGNKVNTNACPASPPDSINNVQGYRKFKYSPADHFGDLICKDVNNNVGCKEPCKNGQRHICNVLLEDGRVCESKNHTRSRHDPVKHGKPQLMR